MAVQEGKLKAGHVSVRTVAKDLPGFRLSFCKSVPSPASSVAGGGGRGGQIFRALRFVPHWVCQHMAIVPDPRGGRKLAVLGHEYTQVEVVNVTNGSATAIIAEWESCWCACINSISVVTRFLMRPRSHTDSRSGLVGRSDEQVSMEQESDIELSGTCSASGEADHFTLQCIVKGPVVSSNLGAFALALE